MFGGLPEALAGGGYTKYNQSVTNTLENLQGYGGGRTFQHNGAFALAYFSTPYQKGDSGCVNDMILLHEAETMLEFYTKADIRKVLVFSPPEAGDPPSDFAQRYTNPKNGNMELAGLTGDKNTIIETARNYRLPYVIDRSSGKITDHNRSGVLVAPDGSLLAKFDLGHRTLSQDLAASIKDYNTMHAGHHLHR